MFQIPFEKTQMHSLFVFTAIAHESLFQVVCQRVYSHKAQVLDIVASPTSTQQFLSAHAGDDGAVGCTLWSMQDLHSAVVMTLTSPLEALATFPDALTGMCCPSPRNSASRYSSMQLILSALTPTSFIAQHFPVFLRMPLNQEALEKQAKVI